MTRPSWLGRAVRNRHRHAIEQASHRWRGGRREDSARTRRKILISTQVGAWAGYSLAGVIFWRGEVKRALKFVQSYPRLMEHALLSSGDQSSIQNKYERDADLTTWVRADGCSRWLRTARMSWLVLAAQKVAPSVQQIEDAKRDKLIQADIEGQ